MMKTVPTRIISKLGVALALAAMVVGVAAASASATLPEFVLSSPGPSHFSGGTMTLETTAAEEGITRSVTCKGTIAKMESEGLHFNKWTGTMQFIECKLVGVGGNCSSSGSKEGEIASNTMEMRLVYLSKATHEVGVVLNYKASGEQATLATFTCVVAGIGFKFTVRGTALAKITPVNKKASRFPFSYEGSKGKPTLTEYENESGGKVATKLEVRRGEGAWEAANFKCSLEYVLNEPAGEIKA